MLFGPYGKASTQVRKICSIQNLIDSRYVAQHAEHRIARSKSRVPIHPAEHLSSGTSLLAARDKAHLVDDRETGGKVATTWTTTTWTRTGAHDVQLDLFLDYASNVDMYPTFQQYFREHQPPLLAVWGNGAPFFVPAGAEAFKRDIKNAKVTFFDTGRFALETHCDEIAVAIRDLLPGLSVGSRGDKTLREA